MAMLDLQPSAPPVCQVRARLGQHELADLADQSHLFGDGDELVGRNRPVYRVVPAGERLDLHDLVGANVTDSVVHDAELRFGLKGMSQEPTQHEPPAHALVVLHGVHLDGRPAFLGQVHGNVGSLEEQGHVVTMTGSEGDPGAGSHGECEPVHLNRAGQHRVELVDDRHCLLQVADVRDDQSELVTSETRDRGPLRGRSLEALGDLEEESVSDGMAQCVVDVLEAVEIEQHDGDALTLVERGRGATCEEHPVGKPGEHVVRRLVGLAVHFVPKFLHQAGALQVDAGIGDESPEKPKIVFVEFVKILVAVQGDDGADRRGLAPMSGATMASRNSPTMWS